MHTLSRTFGRQHALVLALSSAAVAANAATDSGALVLEEIVVTAQVRSESALDVPISVSTVSGETIERAGISNLEALSEQVPNFVITQDPIGDKLNIRGIHSSEQAGLEQSVGSYLDGVYHGRGVQSRFSFLDVERVEVLRGPQGTLFGKNTVAGALNLTTAKPTDRLDYSMTAGYEVELEETELQGFVSGPFSDNVRGRVAFQTHDQNKGWLDNTFYGETSPQSEDWAARGSLDWDLGVNTLLRLRIEHGEWELFGQPFGSRTAGPFASLPGALNVQGGSFDRINMGNNNPIIDLGSNGNMDGDSSEYALTLEHSFVSGNQLLVTAAYSAYDYLRQLDADFGPVDLLRFDDNEDFDQTSLSVRFVSDNEGPFNYIAGLYYQEANLVADGITYFNLPGGAPIVAAGCTQAGLSANDALAIFGLAATAGNPAATPGQIAAAASAAAGPLTAAGSGAAVNVCTTYGALQALPDAFNRVHSLDQEADSASIYGQMTWRFTDGWQLTAGLRFTQDEKSATQLAYAANFGSLARNDALAPNLAVFGEATPHVFTPDDLSRDEDSLTGSASLQWDVNDAAMIYLTGSTGFKAGGFNSFALGADPEEAEFEEEEVLNFELGTKLRLLDGAAELSIAAFNTNIENLQIAQFTGSTSFIVQNAAEAEIRGVEIDGRWRLTQDLSVSGAFAYTDFEFTSFPRAGCAVQQLLALRENVYGQGRALLSDGNAANDTLGILTMLAGGNQTLQDCSELGLNNLGGQTTEQVPEFIAVLGVDYRMELGAFYLDSLFNVVWNDEQYRQTDLDPDTLSDAYAKANLSFTLSPAAGRWQAALIVRNLFNEETYSYANDTPLFDGASQSIVDRPRTIQLQATWRL